MWSQLEDYGFWLGSSPGRLVQAPIRVLAGFESQPRESKSQSEVHGFSWQPQRDSDTVRKCWELGLSPKEARGTPQARHTEEDTLPISAHFLTSRSTPVYLGTSNCRSRTELLISILFSLTLRFFSYILAFLFIPALFLSSVNPRRPVWPPRCTFYCFYSPPSDPYKCWAFIQLPLIVNTAGDVFCAVSLRLFGH